MNGNEKIDYSKFDKGAIELHLLAGCAACESYKIGDGCQDPHGLEMAFGQLPCKWFRRSPESFSAFMEACGVSCKHFSLQNAGRRI